MHFYNENLTLPTSRQSGGGGMRVVRCIRVRIVCTMTYNDIQWKPSAYVCMYVYIYRNWLFVWISRKNISPVEKKKDHRLYDNLFDRIHTVHTTCCYWKFYTYVCICVHIYLFYIFFSCRLPRHVGGKPQIKIKITHTHTTRKTTSHDKKYSIFICVCLSGFMYTRETRNMHRQYLHCPIIILWHMHRGLPPPKCIAVPCALSFRGATITKHCWDG